MLDSKIYIVGVGMMYFGWYLEVSIFELLDIVILCVVDDVGCIKVVVEVVYYFSVI